MERKDSDMGEEGKWISVIPVYKAGLSTLFTTQIILMNPSENVPFEDVLEKHLSQQNFSINRNVLNLYRTVAHWLHVATRTFYVTTSNTELNFSLYLNLSLYDCYGHCNSRM